MPQVDFYVLSASGEEACARFACRLSEKAYRLNHRIHLHLANETIAHRLDELLWTFRDGSFVPHDLLTGHDSIAPVTIGYSDIAPAQADLLINLTDEIPSFAESFERVAEIVDADPDRRQRSRRRYAEYREKGFSISSHTID